MYQRGSNHPPLLNKPTLFETGDDHCHHEERRMRLVRREEHRLGCPVRRSRRSLFNLPIETFFLEEALLAPAPLARFLRPPVRLLKTARHTMITTMTTTTFPHRLRIDLKPKGAESTSKSLCYSNAKMYSPCGKKKKKTTPPCYRFQLGGLLACLFLYWASFFFLVSETKRPPNVV